MAKIELVENLMKLMKVVLEICLSFAKPLNSVDAAVLS